MGVQRAADGQGAVRRPFSMLTPSALLSPLHSRLSRGKWASLKNTVKGPPSQASVNQTGSRKGFCYDAGVAGHNVTPAAL